MEKYRREGSVVRLQTGLGATVRGARAGCARAGALQGTGGAAIPTSEGFLLPPPPSHPTADLMVQRGCRICTWVRGSRVPGVRQGGVNA